MLCGGAIVLCRPSKRYQRIHVVDCDGGGTFGLAPTQVENIGLRVYVVRAMNVKYGCGRNYYVSVLGAVATLTPLAVLPVTV